MSWEFVQTRNERNESNLNRENMHFNPGPHFLKNFKMIKQTQNHVVLWVQILEMIIDANVLEK